VQAKPRDPARGSDQVRLPPGGGGRAGHRLHGDRHGRGQRGQTALGPGEELPHPSEEGRGVERVEREGGNGAVVVTRCVLFVLRRVVLVPVVHGAGAVREVRAAGRARLQAGHHVRRFGQQGRPWARQLHDHLHGQVKQRSDRDVQRALQVRAQWQPGRRRRLLEPERLHGRRRDGQRGELLQGSLRKVHGQRRLRGQRSRQRQGQGTAELLSLLQRLRRQLPRLHQVQHRVERRRSSSSTTPTSPRAVRRRTPARSPA